GGAFLAFGGGQLGGHGVGLALALGGAQPGGGAVPGQARDLVLQLPDLLPAGEQACRPLDAAAGEAAPGVDHLAVHGDDPVAVVRLPGHPGGGVADRWTLPAVKLPPASTSGPSLVTTRVR